MEENTTLQPNAFETMSNTIQNIKDEISKVVIGQDALIDMLLVGIIAKGHLLVEGVPGVAKTLTAKLLAQCIHADFSRIQFTPDLMPADVLGTSVFNAQQQVFEYKKGPIFGNIVLIDEINRAPAKTQAALFEVMEERQVTNDGHTHKMGNPFMVVATQNPIEQEGTYRLPEAQLDRFLFKLEVTYPGLQDEISMLQAANSNKLGDHALQSVKPVVTAAEIIALQDKAEQVFVEEHIIRYIVHLVKATRENGSLFMGASPRASIAVLASAKAYALVAGRDFVTPDDVVTVVPAILRHRIVLTPEREMEGITTNDVIAEILKSVEVPR
ncbi:magnesium chelatase [Chitinophaga caeni]|uniref:Magnesium chelatase n=1 Tax=Chitinophaga caeni TaxID=2029983 RepID=A0A291QQY7_9BACT|nr:MoxR family ATPase [Chitinophaga caeni]ATL46408.1 magnesium chelatase [Chitinophaga caeni]